MAAYPVRGLDIGASYTIYNLLNAQKEQGVSVIFVGEDLDVLLALCDRIMVLCDGQVSGIVDARTASKEEIGYMMTSLGGVDKSQNQEKGDENND
jgi:simple sugar transport system ATP-binding protein